MIWIVRNEVLTMFISSREKMIMEALIIEKEEITIKELSKRIDVSSRTIQRDLNNIQSYFRILST